MIVFTNFKRYFKFILIRLLEKASHSKEIHPDEVQRSKIQRIIIIGQDDGIAELLLATPAFRAVRQKFPEAYISLLTTKDNSPVVFHNVYVNDVISYSKRLTIWNLNNYLNTIKLLRSGYDLAIVFNTVSHTLTSDLFAFLTGAKYILGSEHLIFPGCSKNFFYNLISPYSEFNKHQTERYLDIIRYIQIDTEDLSEEMNLTKNEKRQAIEYLNKNGIKPEDLIIAVQIDDCKSQNRWEVGKFVEVAKYFSSKHDATIIAALSVDDTESGGLFENSLSFKPLIISGLKIRELTGILYFCDVLICKDNDIMHLAASVGTPLVTIFAEDDPHQRKPLGQQFLAIRGEDGLCSSISEQQVIVLAEKLLTEHPKSVKFRVDDFDISDQILQDYLSILETFDE